MKKKEKEEFERLVAWNEDLKKRIKKVNQEKRKIKKEIKELGIAINELEEKYS